MKLQHKNIDESAQYFIETMMELGHLNDEQRQKFFEQLLKNSESKSSISYMECRKELAVFLFKNKKNLPSTQRLMLEKEWMSIFG